MGIKSTGDRSVLKNVVCLQTFPLENNKERIEMVICLISVDRYIPKLLFFKIETIFLKNSFYF